MKAVVARGDGSFPGVAAVGAPLPGAGRQVPHPDLVAGADRQQPAVGDGLELPYLSQPLHRIAGEFLVVARVPKVQEAVGTARGDLPAVRAVGDTPDGPPVVREGVQRRTR